MEAKVFILVAFAFMGSFPPGSAQEAYQKKATDAVNQYRAKHHVPALKSDDQLNDVAVKCAQYYANQRKIDHKCPHKTSLGTVGENLFAGTGQSDQMKAAETSVTRWYDEVKLYDYSRSSNPKTGHFTQVVWKGSQKFGYGLATNNGFTVGVAIFSPPGNYVGQYKENVLKP